MLACFCLWENENTKEEKYEKFKNYRNVTCLFPYNRKYICWKCNQYSLSQIRKLYTKYKDNKEITTKISYYGFTLNPQEEALFWENPWKAINACYYGKSAQDETVRVFGYNGHNDASDAFRHAYWNALMVKHIDNTWANRWATAHEEGASGQPEIEKQMDLWNNSKGRIIASNNPNADDSQLSNKVVEALNNGVLRKIVDNTLVPTP